MGFEASGCVLYQCAFKNNINCGLSKAIEYHLVSLCKLMATLLMIMGLFYIKTNKFTKIGFRI